MTLMTSYERFAEFYDAVMGDRRAAAEQVKELIRAAKPDAKNVLELGCGTGSILRHLRLALPYPWPLPDSIQMAHALAGALQQGRLYFSTCQISFFSQLSDLHDRKPTPTAITSVVGSEDFPGGRHYKTK